MKIISIGKGMCRVVVRSKEKRERLSRIPDVKIDGERVIFPESLAPSIKSALETRVKRERQKPKQSELF